MQLMGKDLCDTDLEFFQVPLLEGTVVHNHFYPLGDDDDDEANANAKKRTKVRSKVYKYENRMEYAQETFGTNFNHKVQVPGIRENRNIF